MADDHSPAPTEVLVDHPAAHVARITLHGPDTRNALSLPTFDQLADAVRTADLDPHIRVIILTGTPPGFCSGFRLEDAADLPDLDVEAMVAVQQRAASSIIALRSTSTPVIAAIGGAAAGAGLSLALASDIRVAVPDATFNAAFVRIGFTGGDCGSSWLLPRAIGAARAAEILLTGRLVPAEEAERIGLLTRVVEPHVLQDAALEIAAALCRNSPFGVALTKRVLHTNIDAPSLEAAIELENRNQVLATRSAGFREALSAFRERRAPQF